MTIAHLTVEPIECYLIGTDSGLNWFILYGDLYIVNA